jgi:hypothetical protein
MCDGWPAGPAPSRFYSTPATDDACGAVIDYLVSDGQQAGRHGEAECLIRLHIDDIRIGRLNHRPVGRASPTIAQSVKPCS